MSGAIDASARLIRAVRPADLPALHRLVMGLARYEKLEAQVVSTIGDFAIALFGPTPAVEAVLLWPTGTDQGEPVAFALYFHNFSTFLGQRGLYLEDLFVEPDHRGRGHGKALLKHLARIAVERGCGRFEWSVLDWNVDAQAFYASLGAVVMPDWRITRATGQALLDLSRSVVDVVMSEVRPTRHLALKVDVDTLRGTLEGVPRLLDLFDRHGIAATFLYSLGPDHTGRALKRAFRPGFFAKVQRTSVLEHYGLRTLLYGTLLPGPDIGKRGADVMRDSAQRGHETGIHTWDHVLWQDNVRTRRARWTWKQMVASHDRYLAIFGKPPGTHGAAGWQINDDALRQLDTWGMRYASDGRVADDEGDRGPFRPYIGGRALDCVQIPTTLPTLDELIGVDGRDALGAADAVLARTATSRGDEVFTLHAELEGMKLIAALERLVVGWKQQGFVLGSMATAYARIDVDRLPLRRWRWGSIAGRSGELMMAAESIER